MLFESMALPIGLCASYDGLFLIVPSAIVSSVHSDVNFWAKWGRWFASPSVCLLLALSLLTFTANHCVSLVMLRAGSATNYLVMHNLANVLVVCMGIIFFHENDLSSPLMLIGIFMSLGGGIWYAFE